MEYSILQIIQNIMRLLLKCSDLIPFMHTYLAACSKSPQYVFNNSANNSWNHVLQKGRRNIEFADNHHCNHFAAVRKVAGVTFEMFYLAMQSFLLLPVSPLNSIFSLHLSCFISSISIMHLKESSSMCSSLTTSSNVCLFVVESCYTYIHMQKDTLMHASVLQPK